MNIGDYVRTKKGNIGQIININDFREPTMKYGVEITYLPDILFTGDENIIKSSPNIIDLIEIGDIIKYCNGTIGNVTGNDGKYIDTYEDGFIATEDIESIVTKEQFESVEYRL